MNDLFFALGNYLVFLLERYRKKFEWMSLSSVYFFLLPTKVFQNYFIDLKSTCSAWRGSLEIGTYLVFWWFCYFSHRKSIFFKIIGWFPNFYLHPLLTPSGFSEVYKTSELTGPQRNSKWQISELFILSGKSHIQKKQLLCG